MFTGLVEDMGAVGALRFEEEARGGGCELTVRVRRLVLSRLLARARARGRGRGAGDQRAT
jgi:hypothetical protein